MLAPLWHQTAAPAPASPAAPLHTKLPPTPHSAAQAVQNPCFATTTSQPLLQQQSSAWSSCLPQCQGRVRPMQQTVGSLARAVASSQVPPPPAYPVERGGTRRGSGGSVLTRSIRLTAPGRSRRLAGWPLAGGGRCCRRVAATAAAATAAVAALGAAAAARGRRVTRSWCARRVLPELTMWQTTHPSTGPASSGSGQSEHVCVWCGVVVCPSGYVGQLGVCIARGAASSWSEQQCMDICVPRSICVGGCGSRGLRM